MLRGGIDGRCGRAPRRRLLLVALLAGLLPGVPAVASLPSPVLDAGDPPEIAASVLAGSTVTIRWQRLPAPVDEFELLLSIDGGRSFPLRLTPQLEPGLTALAWTVPNLPAHDARLRLRAGVGGREVESPASRPFRIVGNRADPATALWVRDGEVWPGAGAWFAGVCLRDRAAAIDLPATPTDEGSSAVLGPETAPLLAEPEALSPGPAVGSADSRLLGLATRERRPHATPQRE